MVANAPVEMLRSDPEFHASGLKADSLIRLDKLVTASRTIISRRLGAAGPQTRARLAAMLCTALGL